MNVIPSTKQMCERYKYRSVRSMCYSHLEEKKKIEQRTLLYNYIPVKLVSGNWFTPCPMLLLKFERTAKANLSS